MIFAEDSNHEKSRTPPEKVVQDLWELYVENGI